MPRSNVSPEVNAERDPAPETGRRHSRRRPPAHSRAADWTLISLLMLVPVVGLVLFSGVRLYVAGPLMVATFALAAALPARALLRRGHADWRMPPGLAGLALFGVYLFAMFPRAAVPHEALVEGLKYAACVAAYWAFTELTAIRGRSRIALTVPLLLGMCLCWYALLQHADHSRMVLWMQRPAQYGMRASGTLMCPNHFAHVLEILIVLGLMLSGLRPAGWPLRIFGVYISLLALPVLVLTGSRSGWLGSVAGVGVFVLVITARKDWRRLAVVVPAGLLVLLLICGALWSKSALFRERVQEAFEGDVRVDLWHDTVSMAAAEPVTGHGGGSFRWVFPAHQERFAPSENYARYAHNEVLQVAAEYGVTGVVLLLAACLSFAVRLLTVVARARDQRTVYLAAGLLGCMAASLVHSFFDFNLHIFANSHLLAVVAGSLAGALFVSGDLRPVRVPRSVTRIASLAAIALLAVLAVVTVRASASYTLAGRAEKARKKLDFDEAAASARQAQKWDPHDWRGLVQEAHVLKTRAFWERDPDASLAMASEAMTRYRRALELNPYDGYTRLEVSRTLGDLLGDEEGAQQQLREMIAQFPANYEFRGELGLRLRRQGKLEEAFEVFRSARRISPDDEMLILNMRSLRRKLKAMGKEPP